MVFILATTELEKLPDTIISRCQTFTFKKPTTELLKQMVLRVAKSEGYTLEPSSADLLALLASGSFRDALGYVQQVIASSKDKSITPEEVEAVTGAPRSMQLLKLVDAVADGNLDSSLHIVHEIAASGLDMRTVFVLLLRLLRAILLLRAAPSLTNELQKEFTEEEYVALVRHAKDSKTHIHSRLLLALLDAHMRIGTTYTPELPLELALIQHHENTP